MTTQWLTPHERDAWVRFIAVVQLLPGVLDTQLRQDAGLSHFEYLVMAMLTGEPDRTLRMTTLAIRTSSTLSRLSHSVSRMEGRGLVQRVPCPDDGRATDAVLTDAGYAKLAECAPGHVQTVRDNVIDPLTDEQLDQLADIADIILGKIDKQGTAFSRTVPR